MARTDIAIDMTREMARHVDAGSSSDEIDAAMLNALPTATAQTCSGHCRSASSK
jgi:hypothetical protein